MSYLSQCIAWGFGKVLNKFAFVDLKKNNQEWVLQDFAKIYKASMILANCHTCMYNSKTPIYFNLQSPCLEGYLSMEE